MQMDDAICRFFLEWNYGQENATTVRFVRRVEPSPGPHRRTLKYGYTNTTAAIRQVALSLHP